MNVGILGGTFDPIHTGHLIIAEEARLKLGLNHVLFIPAGQPWAKSDKTVTDTRHRVNMVRLAIESNPSFRLSMMEVERSGPTYTVDTLRLLKHQVGDATLFLILGWDSLDDFPQWKEPGEIAKLCRIAAVPRVVAAKPKLKLLDKIIPGLAASTTLLDAPVIGISSSDLRRRVGEGLTVKYLVPDKVEEYIREHGLYR
jgi:nicotinate-nucleotide adenylyltransferase